MFSFTKTKKGWMVSYLSGDAWAFHHISQPRDYLNKNVDTIMDFIVRSFRTGVQCAICTRLMMRHMHTCMMSDVTAFPDHPLNAVSIDSNVKRVTHMRKLYYGEALVEGKDAWVENLKEYPTIDPIKMYLCSGSPGYCGMRIHPKRRSYLTGGLVVPLVENDLDFAPGNYLIHG